MKTLLHAPLLKVAVAFLIGIGLYLLAGNLAFFALLFLLAPVLGIILTRRSPFRQEIQQGILLMGVFVVLGVGWAWVRQDRNPATDWSFLEGEQAVLRGIALKDPVPTPYGRYTWIGLSKASDDSVAVTGNGVMVLYLSQEDTVAFREGDSLLVWAKVKPATSKNAGYLDYLHRNGIFQSANVKAISISPKIRTGFSDRLADLRVSLGQSLANSLQDSVNSGIALAMFLGDKSQLDDTTRAAFASTGLSHILAVSGLHVGIIFLGLGFLFHPVSRLKRGRVWKQLLVLLGLLGYMLIAGAGAAVVRAVMMFGMVLIVKLLGKRTHLLNALAFSAWVQMLWDPEVILDVGFQLSYSAVVGIFLLLPWLEKQWQHDAPVWLRHLYSGMGVTISATVFTTPFVWYYFGTFPTWFLISNVLVSFLAFPLILIGFFTLVLASVCPLDWVVSLMADLTGKLLDILVWWVQVMADMPFAALTAQTISATHGWIIGAQVVLAFALFRLPAWIRKLPAGKFANGIGI